MSEKKLVIVESPAKAATIANYLGKDYQVEASIGHIRDLPQPSELPEKMKKGDYSKFAVNVKDNFDPYYVVSPDKKKKVAELKKDLKDADELYLATDEDREGEAIAWHLLEVLKPKIPVKRMVFHEITKEAIQNALLNTREINQHLVDAQETRRILDRLVGYEVSPVLWRKVGRGLSAGRVQSVAIRMVVERERERMSFVPAHYYDLTADFAQDGNTFTARALSLDGKRFAQGRDFADNGQLKKDALVMDQSLWEQLKLALEQDSQSQVAKVESKPYTRKPAPPFTTSTLQQEAGRKLRMSARETMRHAQHLYENGYITYMRTDSTALSDQAIKAARKQARELYGADSIPSSPRLYAAKAKGAQEAHEAIRPAGSTFRTPAEAATSLNRAEAAVYELIWKRTLASQMVNATGTTDTVHVRSQVTLSGQERELIFTASGTVIKQPGFMAAYLESQDTARYARVDDSKQLPALAVGQALSCQQVQTENASHLTTPPPRFTEASLVKMMEEKGVGRPSTYAATIGVIIDRGYVIRRGQALIPSWLAFSVVRLLEENLSDLVDYDFTALMEADLDQIAAGDKNGRNWLKDFYFGLGHDSEQTASAGSTENPENNTSAASAASPATGTAVQTDLGKNGLQRSVAELGEIDARALNSIQLGEDVALRVGRYGPYLEKISDESQRASVPAELAPDELTAEKIAELFTLAADDGRKLGVDPESGHQIVAKNGRFGPYVTEILPEDEAAAETTAKKKKTAKAAKPRTASLFKDMDLATIDLETALKLLSLPRVIGEDEDGKQILAANGRFGPYLKRGTDTRSLTEEAQIFSLTLAEALEILAQPKQRGRRAAKPPLREFGLDPETEKKVVIKDGRFGPYITDGTTNVTVPRGSDPADITEEQAFHLLAEKRAKGPAKPKTAKKSSAKKTTKTAKKTTKTKAKTTKSTKTATATKSKAK